MEHLDPAALGIPSPVGAAKGATTDVLAKWSGASASTIKQWGRDGLFGTQVLSCRRKNVRQPRSSVTA